MEAARDPDNLFDDGTIFRLEIRVRRNGAMSVAGDILQEAYALQVLDAAKQTIKDHNARRKLANGGKAIVPAHDTPWSKDVT